jgi:opacity protein-like surface antigen
MVEGEGSFGHYRIFASADSSKLYEGGVEYDRHSWGKFIGARMDYVAEVLPVVLLSQPIKADTWGDQLAPPKQELYGVGFSPIGFRMLWRSNKPIKPYFLVKGGMLIFDKKALSSVASYENFSFQVGLGVQVRLTRTLDLRAGYSDIHFSNAFVVPSNPGLDVMSCNAGLSYHLGK